MASPDLDALPSRCPLALVRVLTAGLSVADTMVPIISLGPLDEVGVRVLRGGGHHHPLTRPPALHLVPAVQRRQTCTF